MKVKGFLKDVGGASRVTKMRQDLIAKGSPIPDPKDPIRALADDQRRVPYFEDLQIQP